jgi:hypothetical protein
MLKLKILYFMLKEILNVSSWQPVRLPIQPLSLTKEHTFGVVVGVSRRTSVKVRNTMETSLLFNITHLAFFVLFSFFPNSVMTDGCHILLSGGIAQAFAVD